MIEDRIFARAHVVGGGETASAAYDRPYRVRSRPSGCLGVQ